MEERKIALLNLFHHITCEAIESLKQGKWEDIDAILDKRAKIIVEINEMDQIQGTTITSIKINQDLENLIQLEAELKQLLLTVQKEAKSKLDSIRNAKQVKHSYQQEFDLTPDGIFYDKRK